MAPNTSEAHGQVGTFGFPIVPDLGEDSGGEPQERRLVREESDTCATFDLVVEPF